MIALETESIAGAPFLSRVATSTTVQERSTVAQALNNEIRRIKDRASLIPLFERGGYVESGSGATRLGTVSPTGRSMPPDTADFRYDQVRHRTDRTGRG